ncbi:MULTISPECIES: CoA transferase [unclassified Sporosarcina]|uniref:CaiB/BaiF CoA-transferase family protein n=1 Tax=unclassified Sporosarcina TaxID=2647733 RepID=UPI0013041B70|nr:MULTISPECIES: CoA transferase [unclassified Sporosarcina]
MLKDLRILDVTNGPSGSYASKLFASSGAAVTKIVSTVYYPNLFRDDNKYLLYYSNPSKKDAAIRSLLSEQKWDLIIKDSHSCGQQLSSQAIQILNQKEDLVCITIQFPEEVDVDEEQSLQAIAGWRTSTGDPEKEPLTIGGYPAAYLVGAHAATAGLFALLERNWTDKGREVYIDALIIAVSALEGAYSKFKAAQIVHHRVGNRHRYMAPMAIFPTIDGNAFIGAPVDEQWDLFTRWMGVENKSHWNTNDGRLNHYEEIESLILGWSKKMTKEELFETGQAFRMPFGKVQTFEELDDCPQLQHRQLISHKNGGKYILPPFKISKHQLNSSTSYSKPPVESWNKLRIIDLTSMWSGPYCSRLLADQGAEVIKVEAPHRPDGIRANQDNQAPFFRELNRNKKGVTLDLRKESDQEILMDLIESSDVLIENYSPRVMKNFGLTSEVLRQRNEQLIIISLSAFGQTGPYRDFVGYGPTLEAMSGIASLTFYQDETPWLPGFSISDIGAGIHGAFALGATLFSRSIYGAGFTIDVSQYETAIQFIGDRIIEGNKSQPPDKKVFEQSIADLVRNLRLDFYIGIKGEPTLGMPWKSEGWERHSKLAAPLLGEHNDEIKKRKKGDRYEILYY